MNIIRTIIRNEFFWVALGQFLASFGILVGVKVLTSIFTPEVYGEFGLGISLVNLITYSFGIPLASAATRFYTIAKEKGEFHAYFSTLRKYTTVFCVLICFLAMAMVMISSAYWCLILLLAMLWCVDALFNGVHSGDRDRKAVAFFQVLVNWGRFIFALLMVYFFKQRSVELILVGFVVSALLNVGIQLLFSKRKYSLDKCKTSVTENSFFRKHFSTYLFPLITVGGMTSVQLFADRWFIKSYVGMAEAGVYFSLYQIAYSPMIIVGACLCTYLSPILFEEAGRAECDKRMNSVYHKNQKLAFVMVSAVLLLGLFVYLVHDLIGLLLLGEKFRVYSYLLPWFVMAGGFYATGTQFLLSVQSGLKTISLIYHKAVILTVALCSYMFGAKYYGFEGVVFASFIFSTLHCFVSFYLHCYIKNKGVELVECDIF